MKKLIPYILAYLIVASGTALYPHVFRHFVRTAPVPFPPNAVAVVLNPGLSHQEFVARLQQVGLSEAHPLTSPGATVTIRPAPLLSLAVHFVFDAVMLSVFVGLVVWFRRIFHADIPDQAHAA
ncbi:MAG: hypothetical protein ABSE48_14040 [Verrucomicrobiota bacterium]|jgi:hypothetical protein